MGYAIVSRHHNNSTSVFVMPRGASLLSADSLIVLRSLLQSTVHEPGAAPRTSRPLGRRETRADGETVERLAEGGRRDRWRGGLPVLKILLSNHLDLTSAGRSSFNL